MWSSVQTCLWVCVFAWEGVRKRRIYRRKNTRFRTCNTALGQIITPVHRGFVFLASTYFGSCYKVGQIFFFFFRVWEKQQLYNCGNHKGMGLLKPALCSGYSVLTSFFLIAFYFPFTSRCSTLLFLSRSLWALHILGSPWTA